MDNLEAQIDDIIEEFDFTRVHVAMTALDWQWQTTTGNGYEVPSIAKLKSMARVLLRESVKEVSVGSGGFHARYYPPIDSDPPYFSLSFVLCEANTFYLDNV